MSQTPEEIRADIEATRGRLGTDVDAVAEKVTPSKIMQRKTERVKGKLGRAKDRIMGSAEDAKDRVMGSTGDAGHSFQSTAQDVGHSLQSTAHDVGETVSDVPHQIARKTSGNPLAAGLIAFGVGWLVSSLIPSTQAEQQAASTLKEKAQPLVEEVKEEVKDSARQIGEDMK